MSTPPKLQRCLGWIQSMLPGTAETEFPEPNEAWLYPTEAPYRIGALLDEAAQSVTVMAYQPGTGSEDQQRFAPMPFLPRAGEPQRQVVPFYFDNRFYGASIPVTGAFFLSLQLKADELEAEPCPSDLKEWFDTAAQWMK